ncbi:hypothetical protein AB1Y20_019963 [Prymnesium parvum]|uniref:Amino acid transporter transmembrane domain-containing protein n=1 Tax=Prymnesium parvum TaxID=97485 RepID=A0AB34JWL2_PRYPA
MYVRSSVQGKCSAMKCCCPSATGKGPPSEATPLSEKSRSSFTQKAAQVLISGHAGHKESLTSSEWHAFFNEMMCLVGIGSLTLPYATKQVGLVISLIGLPLLSYFSWEGIRFVTVCAAEEKKRKALLRLSGKVGVAEDRGAWYSISTAAFGDWGWVATAVVLSVAQLGVSVSYVDQARGTLEYLLHISPSASLSIMWAVLTFLSLQLNPGMRVVAWLSAFALAVMFYTFVLEGYFAWWEGDGHGALRGEIVVARPQNIGVWYGPALFAFEGMGSALSIYDSMGSVDPKPFFGVISASYCLAVAIYMYVILVGYLGWGEDISRVVTHNYPDTSFGRSADYLLSLALVCAYTLQMTPIFQITEEAMLQNFPRVGWLNWIWIPSRALLVGFTVLGSAAIPSIERVCALTGSLAFSGICFILPGVLFLKLTRAEDMSMYEKTLSLLFIPLGLVLGIWGFIATLEDDSDWDPVSTWQAGESLAPYNSSTMSSKVEHHKNISMFA